MSSFTVPTKSQRRRLARAMQLDSNHLPVWGSFTDDGDPRGLMVVLPDGEHATLALDGTSVRPVPNLHVGPRTVLTPDDLAVLTGWMRNTVLPAFERALHTSTLVLGPMKCLEILEPTLLPYRDLTYELTRGFIENHCFKTGMRQVVDHLVGEVECPSLVEVEPVFAYGAARSAGWPLVDEHAGIVVVPGPEFDVLVSLFLLMSKVGPVLAGPAGEILDMLGVEPQGDPVWNLHRMAPYTKVVGALRSLGARFLVELEERGWGIIT